MVLSSTKVEYKVICEVVWLKNILTDIVVIVDDAAIMSCDNQSCMIIANNLVFYART